MSGADRRQRESMETSHPVQRGITLTYDDTAWDIDTSSTQRAAPNFAGGLTGGIVIPQGDDELDPDAQWLLSRLQASPDVSTNALPAMTPRAGAATRAGPRRRGGQGHRIQDGPARDARPLPEVPRLGRVLPERSGRLNPARQERPRWRFARRLWRLAGHFPATAAQVRSPVRRYPVDRRSDSGSAMAAAWSGRAPETR